MKEVNVVITYPLDRKYVEQIAAVDPRLKVHEAGLLVQAELGFPKYLAVPWLWDTSLKTDVSAEQASRELDRLLGEAEVLYHGALPANFLARCPRLKWIQAAGAGLDDLVKAGVLDKGIIVTSTKGIQAITIPEWALGLMFMLAKQAPRLVVNQQQRNWERYVPIELYGKTVAILGAGNIGMGLAKLCKGMGMKVIATRRSAAKREKGPGAVDEMYPPDDLRLMLSQCDFAVNCMPATAETRGIVGEAELKSMKPTAYLVSISRGGIVDERALIRALKEHWIAGAGMDVFETEPLPAESELWGLPNAILSPHNAGATPHYNERATALFCDNIRRYLSGQPLVNLADKKASY